MSETQVATQHPGEFRWDRGMRTMLRAKFPPEQVGKLPASKGRPALDFVGHAAVTDRLNAVAPGWSYSIDEVFTVNGRCWIRGTVQIGGVGRPEFGDGTNPKEAVGNLIRRGAMRFGVALDLWSREELDGYEDSAETTAGAGPDSLPLAPEGSPPHERTSAEPPDSLGASGQGAAEAEGASGSLTGGLDSRSLRERPDWARIARDLGTSQTDAKAKVLRFLRSADVAVRAASEINADLADWAVASMQSARQRAPA